MRPGVLTRVKMRHDGVYLRHRRLGAHDGWATILPTHRFLERALAAGEPRSTAVPLAPRLCAVKRTGVNPDMVDLSPDSQPPGFP